MWNTQKGVNNNSQAEDLVLIYKKKKLSAGEFCGSRKEKDVELKGNNDINHWLNLRTFTKNLENRLAKLEIRERIETTALLELSNIIWGVLVILRDLPSSNQL